MLHLAIFIVIVRRFRRCFGFSPPDLPIVVYVVILLGLKSCLACEGRFLENQLVLETEWYLVLEWGR